MLSVSVGTILRQNALLGRSFTTAQGRHRCRWKQHRRATLVLRLLGHCCPDQGKYCQNDPSLRVTRHKTLLNCDFTLANRATWHTGSWAAYLVISPVPAWRHICRLTDRLRG